MLFLVYWELNESTPVEQRLQAAQKLMSSGMFPPKNTKIVRWDGTPNGWGMLTLEADRVEDVYRAVEMWRASLPGFFHTVKTSPALPITEAIPLIAEVAKAVKS